VNAGGAVTCHRNSSGAHTRASTVSIDAKPRGAVLQPARDFSPPGSIGRLTPRRGLEFAVLELFHAVNLASLPATRSRHFGRWRRAEDRRGDTDRAVCGRPSMCCTVFRRSPARTSRRRKRMWISRGGGKDWRNRWFVQIAPGPSQAGFRGGIRVEAIVLVPPVMRTRAVS